MDAKAKPWHDGGEWGGGQSFRKAALRSHGVVVEPMDTGAAARTYNVLAAEGRKVRRRADRGLAL